MAYDTQRLGAWYNNWGDLWGDIKDGVSAVVGGGGGGGAPPGYRPIPYAPGYDPSLPPGAQTINTGAALTNADLDQFDVIAEWTQMVREDGGAPTRLPSSGTVQLVSTAAYTSQWFDSDRPARAGMLAARWTGPGTSRASMTPQQFSVAPDQVLDADAAVGQKMQAQIEALVPPAAGDKSLGDILGDLGKYAGLAIGAAVILPALLRPSRNPRGRRRRRRRA